MAPNRKRLRGEPNPMPDPDAPMRVVQQSRLAGRDHGIVRGVAALLAWRKRRTSLEHRARRR